MTMTTGSSSQLIRTNVWSAELKQAAQDELNAMGIVKVIPDFIGTTLNIPSVGEATLQTYVEDSAVTYTALDTGNFTFTIDQYLASGTYITELNRKQAFYASELEAGFVPKQHRALMEHIETRIFGVTQNTGDFSSRGGQTVDDDNAINGADHRYVGTGTNETMTPEDLFRAKYALKKANMPMTNLVGIVDPSVAYAFETATNLVNVSNNPRWEGVIETGLTSGMRFIKNVAGFDLWESNYLPTANETITATIGGALTTSAGKSNIFFSADPQFTPFLFAWQIPPTVDSEWNKDLRREEYVTVARYGVSVFRPENLVCILTDTDQV